MVQRAVLGDARTGGAGPAAEHLELAGVAAGEADAADRRAGVAGVGDGDRLGSADLAGRLVAEVDRVGAGQQRAGDLAGDHERVGATDHVPGAVGDRELVDRLAAAVGHVGAADDLAERRRVAEEAGRRGQAVDRRPAQEAACGEGDQRLREVARCGAAADVVGGCVAGEPTVGVGRELEGAVRREEGVRRVGAEARRHHDADPAERGLVAHGRGAVCERALEGHSQERSARGRAGAARRGDRGWSRPPRRRTRPGSWSGSSPGWPG